MNYLTEDVLFAIKMAIVRIADTTLDDAQRIAGTGWPMDFKPKHPQGCHRESPHSV